MIPCHKSWMGHQRRCWGKCVGIEGAGGRSGMPSNASNEETIRPAIWGNCILTKWVVICCCTSSNIVIFTAGREPDYLEMSS